MFILPFQFLLDGRRGTLISGTILMSPGLTTITGMLSDLDDGVIIKFDLSISVDLISTTLSGHVVIEIEDLGEATIYFNIIDSILGTSVEANITADFDPEDFIDWLCCDPADTDLRSRLLTYLPALDIIWAFGLNTSFSDDLDDDGPDEDDWDLEAFEEDPHDTPPVSRWSEGEYVISSFQIDGVTYVLDGLKWVRADMVSPSVTRAEASHMARIWRDLDLRLTGTEAERFAWIDGLQEGQDPIDPDFLRFLDEIDEPPRVVAREYVGPQHGGLTVEEIVRDALSRPGPVSPLPVEVIVAQVLRGDYTGRGSTQL